MKPSDCCARPSTAHRRALGPDNPETLKTSSLLDTLLRERARLAAKKPKDEAGVPKSPQIAPPPDR